MQTMTHCEPIHRELWRKLDATVKWVLIGQGKVVIDDDGHPRLTDAVTAQAIADIEAALGLRKRP